MLPDRSSYDVVPRRSERYGGSVAVSLILMSIVAGIFIWLIYSSSPDTDRGQNNGTVTPKPKAQMDKYHPPGLGLDKMFTR